MTDPTTKPCRTQRKNQPGTQPPAPELASAFAGLAPGKALDVAAGLGRHALWLADLGWQVTAVDISITAGSREGVAWVRRDLEQEPSLPFGEFDAVICWLYWQANLLPAIRASVKPGGLVALAGKTAGRFATSLAAYRNAFTSWEEIESGEDEFKIWLIARRPSD